MTLLFQCDDSNPTPWLDALAAAMPDRAVRVFPELGDPSDIEYALVYRPPHGLLKSLPNLKAVFSLWAGVEHLIKDPDAPAVPIVRMVERGMTTGMTGYVVMQTLNFHRRMQTYREQQVARQWRPLQTPPSWQRRVGVMGLGTLGKDAAEKLAGLAFDVVGWSRSQKQLGGVRSYHGDDQLQAFLHGTEILICLLPLTPATRRIVNRDLLSALPAGACIINCARGGHVVERDLLDALDSGHIAGAALDVFEIEPLPADHPFWTHPGVIVTPHSAAYTLAETAVASVAAGIARVESGRTPGNAVDLDKGY